MINTVKSEWIKLRTVTMNWVLTIIAIVFPILGGLKARDGILWKYPITITFLK